MPDFHQAIKLSNTLTLFAPLNLMSFYFRLQPSITILSSMIYVSHLTYHSFHPYSRVCIFCTVRAHPITVFVEQLAEPFAPSYIIFPPPPIYIYVCLRTVSHSHRLTADSAAHRTHNIAIYNFSSIITFHHYSSHFISSDVHQTSLTEDSRSYTAHCVT